MTNHDPSQRTRMLSSFESVGDVQEWLAFFDVTYPHQSLKQMWDSMGQAQGLDTDKDYRLTIKGNSLQIERKGPRRPRRQAERRDRPAQSE